MFTDAEINELAIKHLEILRSAGVVFLECQPYYFRLALNATIKSGGDLEKAMAVYTLEYMRFGGYSDVSAKKYLKRTMRGLQKGASYYPYMADAFEAAYACALGEIEARKDKKCLQTQK